MREEIVQWRHAVALWCLRFGAKTAAEVTEAFAAVCQADEVPAEFWRKVDPSSMLGYLRKLEGQGRIERCGEKHDGRAGRLSPQWRLVDPDSVPTRFPTPPDLEPDDKDAPARAASVPHLRPEQALSMVGPRATPAGAVVEGEVIDPQRAAIIEQGFDRLAGMLARHQREIASLVDDLRTSLDPFRTT